MHITDSNGVRKTIRRGVVIVIGNELYKALHYSYLGRQILVVPYERYDNYNYGDVKLIPLTSFYNGEAKFKYGAKKQNRNIKDTEIWMF